MEQDLGDGSYLVKWSPSDTRRAEGRCLLRQPSQSHSTRTLNLYLLQVSEMALRGAVRSSMGGRLLHARTHPRVLPRQMHDAIL